MAYNIRALLKIRDLGDSKPVVHTFFTSDEREPAVAKKQFESDNPGARNVELFRASKPCKASEFDKLLTAAEDDDKITLPPPPPAVDTVPAPIAESTPAPAPQAG